MWLFVLAVVIGIVIGRLRGGSIADLADTRVEGLTLLLLGTAAGLVPGLFGVGGWVIEWASFGLLGAFAVRNLFLIGMPIFLVGLALNFGVVAINGGMPVRDSGLVGANLATHDSVGNLDLGPRRHLATDDDVLVGLADTIPIPALHAVVSFGDLIMAAGIANVVSAAARPKRRRDERMPLLEPDFVAAARAATRPNAPGIGATLPEIIDPARSGPSPARAAAENLGTATTPPSTTTSPSETTAPEDETGPPPQPASRRVA